MFNTILRVSYFHMQVLCFTKERLNGCRLLWSNWDKWSERENIRLEDGKEFLRKIENEEVLLYVNNRNV